MLVKIGEEWEPIYAVDQQGRIIRYPSRLKCVDGGRHSRHRRMISD